MDTHPYELDHAFTRGDLVNENDAHAERGDLNDENSQTVEGQPLNKKTKSSSKMGRRTSRVWDHYSLVEQPEGGGMIAYCSYCKKQYNADGRYGTSNAKRHTESCMGYKNFLAKNPKTVITFDQDMYCKLFVDAILFHNYPLSIVEHKKLRELHHYLNPEVKDISRYKITKYCMARHIEYKEVLTK
ncbi:unnamed protein product [Amaranthus hypochondriacus]